MRAEPAANPEQLEAMDRAFKQAVERELEAKA
jgi:hypothetical protein